MPPASATPELETPPSVGVSLRSSFQWSLVGNVVYSACQWGILIVLAKLGSPESVGQFALGLAVTAPIILFANLQLSALQATDARREFRFGHYLALRLITTALALALIAILAVSLGYSPVTAAVVLAVGVAKAFESISDSYYGLLQQHCRLERVAWSLMLRGTLSVAAVVVGLWLTNNVLGAVIALAVVWGLMTVLYDAQSVAWLRAAATPLRPEETALCWDRQALARLAWQALPVGIRVMLFTLCVNIPRYFIEEYHGTETLGIFAALAYVTVVAQMVSNSLGQAAAPRLATLYAAGDIHSFRMLVLKLTAVGALLGGGGIVLALIVGRPLLALLYQPAYAEHAGAFVWIMIGAALWCVATMLVVAANAARCQASQAVAAVVVALATVAASLVLIPTESLAGAAMTTVVSAAVGLSAFGIIFLTIGRPHASDTLDGVNRLLHVDEELAGAS